MIRAFTLSRASRGDHERDYTPIECPTSAAGAFNRLDELRVVLCEVLQTIRVRNPSRSAIASQI